MTSSTPLGSQEQEPEPEPERAWQNKRRPGQYDHDEDQNITDGSLTGQFKESLLSKYGGLIGGQDAGLASSSTLTARVLMPNSSPTYPISSFLAVTSFPDKNELAILYTAFAKNFWPRCPFIDDIPLDRFDFSKSHLTLAAAAVGSFYEKTASSPPDLLRLAMNTLTAMPALDNRFTRSNEWPLSWVMLQAAALMLGDNARLRTLHQWHGLVLAGSRRSWTNHRPVAVAGSSWSNDHQSSLILSYVLFDTIQGLSLNTVCAAYQLLMDAPLAPPFTSLQRLLSMSVFGNPDSRWPSQTRSPKAALVMLIVLLNETLIWARTITSHDATLGLDTCRSSRTIVMEEHNAYQRKIDRALDKWVATYDKTTYPSMTALFRFCKLLLKCPGVLVLPMLADQNAVGTDPLRDKTRQSWQKDEQLVSHGLEQAWLIFEQAAEATGTSPPWMPIILYFAALTVWSGIGSGSTAGIHVTGSIQVLRVFEDELRRIGWPVCQVLCENLAVLRRTRKSLS